MADITEREHRIGLFDELVCRGAGTVQVVSGPDPHLVVVGPDELVDRVVVRYRGTRLVVSFRMGPNPLVMLQSAASQVRAIVVTDALSKVVLQGAGSVQLGESPERPFTADELRVIHSGAGSVSGTVEAETLTVRLRGVGGLSLGGDAGMLDARVSGIGSLDCLDLVCKRARVGLSGIGSCKIMVLDEISASVSGAGSLMYRGSGHLKRRRGSTGRIEHIG